MTQVNPGFTQSDLNDDTPSEYNFSGTGVRGKFAKTLRENGYSVTIDNDDGTTSTRHVSPIEVMEQNRQREFLKQQSSNHIMTQEPHQTWTGDRIAGDKVGGDKVMGNKVQIGTVQGDTIAGNKITQSQNLAQAAQEITDLVAQLKLDYPNDDDFTQAGRTVGAITNNPTLKQRLINAAKESGTTAVEKVIESVVNNPAISIVVAGVRGFINTDQ